MTPAVVLAPGAAGAPPSGLADMLQQFLAQQLEADAGKARAAGRISGDLLFRAAEDTAVCVRLSFARARIEVADHDGPPRRWPALTADFLTTAHLTCGEASPLALVWRRKLRVRCAPWHALFLLRVLQLMRVEPAPGPAAAGTRRRWTPVVATLALVALVALAAWLFTR